MTLTVDYYFAPNSPWTYLGHQRFAEIATRGRRDDQRAAGGPGRQGVPGVRRAAAVQARAAAPGLPADRAASASASTSASRIVLQPKFFPVNADDAAKLIIAVDMHDGSDAAMRIAGRILRGVWVEERNIADARDLAKMLEEEGLPARRLDDSMSQAVHVRYEQDTQRAIDAGVFGAPSYVIDGELFWGQDRLDFVQRRLARG